MYELTGKEMQRLVDLAEPHYPTRDDIFHNLDHPYEVWDRRRSLGELASLDGVENNPQVGKAAAMWHDADTVLDPQDFYLHRNGEIEPASCSEAVAGAMFNRAARRMGLPDDFIIAVEKAIDGTNPRGALDNVEAKLLAAADTYLIGHGTYETFMANTHKLHREAEWKNAQKIAWEQFVAGSIYYLGLFVVRNVQVTPDYYDDQRRSIWHIGALGNILRLADDTWQNVSLAGETVPVNTAGQDWRTARNLRIVLTTLGETKSGHKDKPHRVVLAVPMETESLSVPDAIFDVLRIDDTASHNPQTLREAKRAIKPNGRLIHT